MDNQSDDPLGEAAGLRNTPSPSADLEHRVVEALRHEGLVRTRSAWPGLAAIAAALLIFVAGAAIGHYLTPGAGPDTRVTNEPNRYLLLLAGDVTPAVDGSSRAAEYGEWARGVAARGMAISGDELAAHAEVVTNTKSVTFPDLSSVGGYFLIEAADDAAAAALARTCPHVRYGGSIVVRRVQGR
jgi:hypothetical protein